MTLFASFHIAMVKVSFASTEKIICRTRLTQKEGKGPEGMKKRNRNNTNEDNKKARRGRKIRAINALLIAKSKADV